MIKLTFLGTYQISQCHEEGRGISIGAPLGSEKLGSSPPSSNFLFLLRRSLNSSSSSPSASLPIYNDGRVIIAELVQIRLRRLGLP